MKYLVLGSHGKIGKFLVKYLQKENHEVFTWDIATNSEEDLRISHRIDDLINRVDFVYFLAYDIGGSGYLKKYQNTFEFIDNNIKIMTNTFNALKYFNKPFIFTSSEMANLTFSTYGLLKSIGDSYVKSLNSVVTKLWNTYSTDDGKDISKSHVINDFIRMAKTDGKIVIKTNGKEERQLLYVNDCCECLYILSQNYHNIDRNKEIHIASFRWVSIMEIAKLISNLIGNVPIETSDALDSTHQNIKIEPDSYVLNFWKPKTSLETGILKIIDHQN